MAESVAAAPQTLGEEGNRLPLQRSDMSIEHNMTKPGTPAECYVVLTAEKVNRK